MNSPIVEVAGNEKTCSLVIILNDRSFRRSVRIEKEVKRILWSSRIKEFPIPKIYLSEGRDSFEKTEILGG